MLFAELFSLSGLFFFVQDCLVYSDIHHLSCKINQNVKTQIIALQVKHWMKTLKGIMKFTSNH